MNKKKLIHNLYPSNQDAWNIKIYTMQQIPNMSSTDLLSYLCAFGNLAPSTHNTQPWKFQLNISQNIISVFLDKNLILPASDKLGRQAVISIGCCIENIIIAAEYFEFNAQISYISQRKNISLMQKRYMHMAEIYIKKIKNYKKTHTEIKKLFLAIKNRKVIRAEFNPSIKIPMSLEKQIQKYVDDNQVQLHIIKDSIRKFALAEFQAQADNYVINIPKFSRELGQWLLPNDTKSFSGMPGIGFGLKDKEAIRIHKGLIEQTKLEPEDGLKFTLAGKIGIEKAPFIGILSVLHNDYQDWLMAGRNFERIFLKITSEGYHLAVHAGIAEVELISKIFGASLGTTRKIALMFRCGKLLSQKDLNRPHSPRTPIENLFI